MNKILVGDKIEKLLWEYGLDFTFSDWSDALHLHISAGPVKLVVADVYGYADEWHLESDDEIGIEVWTDGYLVADHYSTFGDEHEFVLKILEYVE